MNGREDQEYEYEDSERPSELTAQIGRSDKQPLKEKGKWDQQKQVKNYTLNYVIRCVLNLWINPRLKSPGGAAVRIERVVVTGVVGCQSLLDVSVRDVVKTGAFRI